VARVDPGDPLESPGGVDMVRTGAAEPALASRIAGLAEAGLSYLGYDWSPNDSARNK